MSKNIDIELLEKYVGGEIEAHEVRDADGAVLSEQDLLEATLDYKAAVMGLEVAGFRKGLQQASEAYAPAKRSSRPWWFAAAAAVIVLAVVFAKPWQASQPAFDDYFTHFKQFEVFRGGIKNSATAAFEAYSREDYAKAFQLFSEAAQPTEAVMFYQGVSALGIHDFEAAIKLFEYLGTEPSNEYFEQVQWYLSLAYWQAGKVEQGLSLLEQIGEGQFKYEESRTLIDVLKN